MEVGMGVATRRGFLARTLGAAWAGASLMEQAVMRAAQARAEAKSAPHPTLFDIVRIADGAWAALARPQPQVNCNAVIFENAGDILIVDAHSKPSAVAALTAQIRQHITSKPVRYVVNTHFHWDHTQGNATYRKIAPHADILASTTTRKLIAELGAARLKASVEEASATLESCRRQLASSKTAREKEYYQQMISGTTGYIAEMRNYVPELPTITFDRTLVLHDKAHELHLAFRGRGHTAGDVVVFCPQTKAIATGDLLHGWLPFIDDGYPREWPKTLAALTEFPFDHAVGGHGDVQQGRERLGQMSGYISELTELVEAGKRQGRGVKDLQASITPAKLTSLSGAYREFLEAQFKRFQMAAGRTPPEQLVTDGVKTNVAEVFATLDRG
jgi:glyoxylase-like metal-dependent hydrolase (beta-lactamase superfamily II)